jgi:hypothetical protein
MEVIRVFDKQTPALVGRIADALSDWTYTSALPTDDARCLGFILEQALVMHVQSKLPDVEALLGGAIEYPNVAVSGGGLRLALEVKASPRTKQISNRVKSPESILRFYPRYDGHWVMALFYRFAEDGIHLADLRGCMLELWRYAATTFKDMSAICALGSLDQMVREAPTERAFRTEKEFLRFCSYMASHPGTTAQRNAASQEWLRQRRPPKRDE